MNNSVKLKVNDLKILAVNGIRFYPPNLFEYRDLSSVSEEIEVCVEDKDKDKLKSLFNRRLSDAG